MTDGCPTIFVPSKEKPLTSGSRVELSFRVDFVLTDLERRHYQPVAETSFIDLYICKQLPCGRKQKLGSPRPPLTTLIYLSSYLMSGGEETQKISINSYVRNLSVHIPLFLSSLYCMVRSPFPPMSSLYTTTNHGRHRISLP